jgi:hypothetical protein
MKILTVLFTASAFLPVALAQSPDDYRGGWKTEVNGIPRTYEFSIRGETVRGVYCTWCADATTLAFVDGKFGRDGLAFTDTHVDNNGKTTFTDTGNAKFEKPNLAITVTLGGPGGGKFKWTMVKDGRGPDPLPIPIVMLPPGREIPVLGRDGAGAAKAGPANAKGNGPAAAAAPAGGGGRAGYIPPGPWLKLTPEIIVGSWLGFGTGVNKQYFIVKKVGNRLRGMVCGRCDNPYTMAALDDFVFDGETLRFNILHEDWGDYSIPFDKHVTARVSGNEMRIVTSQDNLPPELANRPPNADPNAGTSLIGPISHEATTLNHWK